MTPTFLYILLGSPFVAALLLALVPQRFAKLVFPLSLLLGSVIASVSLALLFAGPMDTTPLAWFPLPGTTAVVQFALFCDGLSAWMMALTGVLTLSVLWFSQSTAGSRFRIFAISVFLMQGALFGSFLASDAVLFFLFFEALIPPTVILIANFGGPNRKRASILFAAYTLAGSLPLAIALWAIASWTGTTIGAEIVTALGSLSSTQLTLLFWAFVIAFAVKTPLFPFHGWQAESYAEAPAGVTALLSGAMAKVGVFGFLRWTIPMFPAQAAEHSKTMIVLGLLTLIYGSLMAWRQTDIKRVLIYSSMSHLGLAVIGCFTFYQSAIAGVVAMMVAHGLSAGALFLLTSLPENSHGTRSIESFGGMSGKAPIFASLFLMSSLAAIAVPGTLGFIGEFLILQGVWQTLGPVWTLLAGLGAILSAAYTLRLVQRLLFGPVQSEEKVKEISLGDAIAVAPLIIALFVLGLAPAPVLRTVDQSSTPAQTAVATVTPENAQDAVQY